MDRLTIKLSTDFFHRKDDSLDEILITKAKISQILKSETKHIALETPARVKQISASGALNLRYEFDNFAPHRLLIEKLKKMKFTMRILVAK